ncbi:MAG: ABC transporter ATP-binding protein [Lachnospiraceae bacterium]|nr:ABC transporter ATP-binding protein [Lachnospiraceae bacterium]
MNEDIKLPLFGLKEMWTFVRKYKVMVIRMIILGFLVSSVDAAWALINRYSIDHFVGGNTLEGLGYLVLFALTIIILQVLVTYRNVRDCSRLELYLNRDMRNAAFAHLQKMSLSYYNTNSVGYIHARVMSDAGKIGDLIAWRLMDVVWNGSYTLIAVVIMFVVDVRLAVIVTAVLLAASCFIVIFQKKLTEDNRLVREINSVITGDINEGITGARFIKNLVCEKTMSDAFKANTLDMKQKSIRTAHHAALFGSTVCLMTCVSLALVLYNGGQLHHEGVMKIGVLSVFMTYALGLLEPVQEIVNTFAALFATQVNIERFTRLVRTGSEVFDSEEVIEKYGDSFDPKYENWEKMNGDVEFSDVTFKYPDGDELVLEHFNLKIKKGEKVAIVGETGAGKTTLVNLVCRFFEPTEGVVLIDGKDIRSRSLKWLHSNIGYVLQTPHLFSGSLRENLRYGKPDATDDEIRSALRTVSALGIMERLEGGLDADLGEGGDRLSMGEKQLFSIARAVLSDPAILVLDEATSSIDTLTEKAVTDAIDIASEGRTTFIIAHRLSTVVNADVILVVDDGKIVERGNHAQLMRQKGVYYSLYMKQFEENS